MERERFEKLVQEALDGLPEEFARRLDNVSVAVADIASPRQLTKIHPGNPIHLLGLYEGIPLTERSRGYAGALPDRITIFQRPIENICHSDEEIKEQVRKTVMHELGHFFGMDEERIRRHDREE